MPARLRGIAVWLMAAGVVFGAGSRSTRAQTEATSEDTTAGVSPAWVMSVPASVPPYAYRGPGTDYARGPDARAMPEYCYPGSLLPSAEEGPGLWAMPEPPPSHGDLWQDTHTPERLWLSVAYLSLWTTGHEATALVTTSPPGTPQGQAGVLPDAEVLFGNERLDTGQRDGGEIRLGYWLVDGQFIGLEGHYWATASESTRFAVESQFTNGAGGIILARPFVNANNGAQDAAILAFPNFNRGGFIIDLSGAVRVETTSILQSAGLTGRHVLWADFERSHRVDLVGGYRFFQVDESLTIRDRFFDPGGGLIGPTTVEGFDRFDTQNDLHSLEIGLLWETYLGRWRFELLGKCGLGNNHQRIRIDGATTTETLGTMTTNVGGLLALPTNIGTYRRDRFAVLPEFNARLRFELTTAWHVFAGYRLMYFNELVRPAEQIDTVVNPTQIGGQLNGAARPAHSFLSTDMWLHGLDLGMEWRW